MTFHHYDKLCPSQIQTLQALKSTGCAEDKKNALEVNIKYAMILP